MRGLVVVVGRRPLPAATALPERRARLDRERVRAHVLGLERERGVERGLPVGDGLTGRAVDEVEVDAVDARGSRAVDRTLDVRGIVRAPEQREHVRAHRLHAERHAVHAGRAVLTQLRRVDRVGVALDRDLGAVDAVDRVEDASEARAGSSDGVPPPKNTLVAGCRP